MTCRSVGDILFRHNLLVYTAYFLVPVSWFLLNKTTLGLKIRAVGENPEAADTMGVSVTGIRYFTCILGGVFSGVAGASLSIALLNVFQQNLTSGQGFIAVALVYFGGWRPFGVLIGSLVFSLVNALQLWVQIKSLPIPSDIAIMMPYVLTILALVIAVQRVGHHLLWLNHLSVEDRHSFSFNSLREYKIGRWLRLNSSYNVCDRSTIDLA